MSDQSKTEENYLKAIYTLSKVEPAGVSTKSIGEALDIKPPTVSDMLKKLGDKKLIHYTPYKGVLLTDMGENIALKIIRKHRLWETFLVQVLEFKWDEVHDIAEQLEHINSAKLVDKLDAHLGFPHFDPHGDPIPDSDGKFVSRHTKTLDHAQINVGVVMVGVKDHSSDFLKYLESMGIGLGVELKVVQREAYDMSCTIELKKGIQKQLSQQVAKNLIIQLGIRD